MSGLDGAATSRGAAVTGDGKDGARVAEARGEAWAAEAKEADWIAVWVAGVWIVRKEEALEATIIGAIA